MLEWTGEIEDVPRKKGDRLAGICVLGLRAFPGVLGGIEKHCEELYPRLAAAGHEITVLSRKPYSRSGGSYWSCGVLFRPLYAPSHRNLETIVHSALATFVAKNVGAKLVHVHGIGPAVMSPLARALGLRVVVTYHSQDYLRAKFGGVGRVVLRNGERAAGKWADEIICVSPYLQRYVRENYNRAAHWIPNGVAAPTGNSTDAAWLAEMGLTAGRYILAVGRISREKNQVRLVEAFLASGLDAKGWQLAIVGSALGQDPYEAEVAAAARDQTSVRLLGYRQTEELETLYKGCGAFCLPSTHEGFPIALLEGLAHGKPCVVSRIRAHENFGIPDPLLFDPLDSEDLAHTLAVGTRDDVRDWSTWTKLKDDVLRRYSWSEVTSRTEDVLRRAMARGDARDGAGSREGR